MSEHDDINNKNLKTEIINEDQSDWYFINQEDKKTYGPLNVLAIKNIIFDNKLNNEKIYVCQKGWSEWKAIIDVKEFNETNSKNSLNLPPIPFDIELSTDIKISENKIENRKHKRIEIRLRAVFISENQTFRTFTQNISEGGMLLQECLPANLSGKNLDLFISSPDSKINIMLQAKVVIDRKVNKHIQFTKLNTNSLNLLKTWLYTDLKNYIEFKKAS